MKTKSSGFTLIELLVVVAILGILSAVGIVSYNGYVSGTKKKTAENIMQQIALKQTERFTDLGSYYAGSDDDINTNLFDGGDVVNVDSYTFTIIVTSSSYLIYARGPGTCLSLNDLMVFDKEASCP